MKKTRKFIGDRRLQLDAASICNGFGDCLDLPLHKLRNWTVRRLIKAVDDPDSSVRKALSSKWGKDSADQRLDVWISYFDGGVEERVGEEDMNRVFGRYYEPKSCRWDRENLENAVVVANDPTDARIEPQT